MNEVTETAAHAALATVEATAGFSEVGDGRKFAVYRPRGIPARVKRVAGCLGVFLVLEPRVDISDEMIIVVVANNYFLNQAVLAHLAPKVLVESVEMVLKLARVHLVLGIEGRILVQVWEENCLRV